MVTVASRCRSSNAIGFPTISLRPMTTACRPAIGICSRTSSSITPDGVHATSAGRFCTINPTLIGVNPSTSFAGAMVSNTRWAASAPIAFGNGDWTRMPSCTGLSFSRSTSASVSASVAFAGSRCRSARKPGLATRLELVTDVNLGGRVVADQNDGQARWPAMAARERGNLRLDLLLHPDGQRLAIQHPCCHQTACGFAAVRLISRPTMKITTPAPSTWRPSVSALSGVTPISNHLAVFSVVTPNSVM